MLRRAVLLCILIAGVTAATASAVTYDITISDQRYADPLGRITDDSYTLVWHNAGPSPHSVTQNTGGKNLGLFDSGPIEPGGSFSYEFDYVGHYGYRDTFTGRRSYIDIGPAIVRNGRTIHYILGVKPVIPGYVFDVERKLKGTKTWDVVVNGTTESEVDITFDPGTWLVRARLRRTADNHASGWCRKFRLVIS